MTKQTLIDKVHLDDCERMLAVWEASVRATHDFLTEADIQTLKPLVNDLFRQAVIPTVCVRDSTNQVIGFAGVGDGKIEMLFIYPAARGKGLGKQFLQYAVTERNATEVDVNEQNEQAVGFYQHMGFEVVGRSALDGQGNPFPILHMRLGNGGYARYLTPLWSTR